MNKINVIGLGYIGLPTAAMFASHDVEVIGVDITPSIVETINKGLIHIEEPGLGELVKEVVESGKLKASLTCEKADAFIVAVPTPNNDDEYKSCDITYVIEATKNLIPYLEKGNLVIIESTIAPRTTEDYVLPLLKEAGFEVGKDIYLAHCPERVLPGQILNELINNNRIIGGITTNCTKKAKELYASFVKGELIETEAKTAEMSKLMENTFRDVNIALANELAKICNKLDINVNDVISMANKHPRVNIHTPGVGVGGHCLAVDPYYICAKAPELSNIIKLSRDTNCSMPHYVFDNVKEILKQDKSKKIAVFGVTYKPDVDDLRESPALEIIELLETDGYNVSIHDPHVKNDTYVTKEEALKDASMLLVLVGHSEFKTITESDLQGMKDKFVFDPTNSLKQEFVVNYGNLWKIK